MPAYERETRQHADRRSHEMRRIVTLFVVAFLVVAVLVVAFLVARGTFDEARREQAHDPNRQQDHDAAVTALTPGQGKRDRGERD